MRETISILAAKTIQIGLVLLAFLIPIFFLPTTSEFYNFNKTTLLIVGAFFLLFVWGVKMVADERVRITTTPLDIPLLLFLGAFIFATLFSIDPVVSFIGAHPIFFGSLLSVAALVILYFLAVTHLDNTYRNVLLVAVTASATILALAFMSYYFGHSLLSQSWATARNWNPVGNLDTLAFFLVIASFLTTSLALYAKQQVAKYLLFILAAIQIIALILINSGFSYVALAAGIVFAILFLPQVKLNQENKAGLIVISALAVLLLILVNISQVGNSIIKPLIAGKDTSISLSKPVRLPLQAAWQSSASSLTVRPIFGSGSSTFGIIFPSFKPLSLNTVNTNNIWNIRFDQPNSGVLDILASTGALGIIAFLVLAFVLLRVLINFSSKSELVKNNPYIIFLEASLVAFLFGLIFFDFSVVTATAFFLVAAVFFTVARDWGSNLASEVDLELVTLKAGALRAVSAEGKTRPNSFAWVVFIPAVLLFVGVVFISWKTYQSEFYYRKAIVAFNDNKADETRKNLVAAIKDNPYRDTYHRALLVTDLAIAQALNRKGNLSQNEQNTLSALVTEAVAQGKVITGYEGTGLGVFQVKKVAGTSSYNVANWESLANVYANIGGNLRNDASVHAINTFSQAIRLDPTNPRLYEALGNVYFNLGDVDNAIKNFELATSAKIDYASAHYNLAQAVKRKGDNPARVVNELTATLQILKGNNEKSDVIDKVQKELDAANVDLQKAQKNQPQQKTSTTVSPSATSSVSPK